MLLLALDCSSSRGNVALGRRGETNVGTQILFTREFPAGRGQGGELFSALQDARERAGQHGTLKQITVGLGPGSYSGVRQAIAAATGLSLALGAQLAGVPSVLALQENDGGGPGEEPPACHVVGDARRGTFYYSAVQGARLLHGPELLEDAAALRERLAAHPGWPVLAAESVPPALPAGIDAIPVLPQAARLFDAAPSAEVRGVLEPIYLRPPAITLPRSSPPPKPVPDRP